MIPNFLGILLVHRRARLPDKFSLFDYSDKRKRYEAKLTPRLTFMM